MRGRRRGIRLNKKGKKSKPSSAEIPVEARGNPPPCPPLAHHWRELDCGATGLGLDLYLGKCEGREKMQPVASWMVYPSGLS